ncbi:hypothetical protein AB0M02_39220 [Actinoplanes sp. NPDC051861]|uniref:hypothetical protein n=1 Tax=Actinoplanes sp. NPDC051861 TaxID=3155170 RepID=UPI0034395820
MKDLDLRGSTGVQVGDNTRMHLHVRGDRPAWWTRSAYIEQVRDIAPVTLQDREAELAELAAFCAGEDGCLWLRAGPWAGKSALLSTFVLNPPAGTEVVSFFVTARLAAQSDSVAFTESLLDQLAAIVGQSVPGHLGPAMRDAHRRALLRAAAEKLRDEGRRLVLVVDGLDEDRGARPGSGLSSVASLLPRFDHGTGLRVVVASRPYPELPEDVPDDHPLRAGCVIRVLEPSRHATEAGVLAGRELQHLLHGDQLGQDILGLITACGGALSLADLEELTGVPPYRLEGLLHGIFGRTVISRGQGDFLFAHETLRVTATRKFGAGLVAHRDRLHAWAGGYRARGWPEATPRYLLGAYPRMLAANGDAERLRDLAVDRARHDRMLTRFGGEADAYTEIELSENLFLDRPEIGEQALYELAVLSRYRNSLEARNRDLPESLPAVWALLGEYDRAEAIARSIPEPGTAVQALMGLAEVLSGSREAARAERMVAEARVMADEYAMDETGQARTALALGSPDAESLIRGLGNRDVRGWMLARLALAFAARGAAELAQALAGEAEQEAVTGAAVSVRIRTLTTLAEAAVALGEPDRARRLAVDAGALIGTAENLYLQAVGTSHLVAALAAIGEVDQAEQRARSIAPARPRASALAKVARAAADRDDPVRARRLAADAEVAARSATSVHLQVFRLTSLAESMAEAGEDALARRLIDRAEQLAGADDRHELVRPLLMIGELDRAERLLHALGGRLRKVTAALALVDARVAAGDPERARQLAEAAEGFAAAVTEPGPDLLALIHVAEAFAAVGENARAQRLIDDVVLALPELADDGWAAEVSTTLACTMAEFGEPERAEEFAYGLTDPGARSWVLADLAGNRAYSGDTERADRLVADAHRLAADVEVRYLQALIQSRLVVPIAACGDLPRALDIAFSIADPALRASALCVLAPLCEPADAARLIGEAFAAGSWTGPVSALATFYPSTAIRIAEEALTLP